MKYFEVFFKKKGCVILYSHATKAATLGHVFEVLAEELSDVTEGYEIVHVKELNVTDYENFYKANVTRNVYQAD